MASISVTGQEPWVVARWAFRGLLEHTAPQITLPMDRLALQQAAALDGLHFDLLEPDQSHRLSKAVLSGASAFRDELNQTPTADPRDAELATALTTLIESLTAHEPAAKRDTGLD